MAERSLTPRDDFPPFGYLDNPWQSWKLRPSGVIRSRPPLGMGWHVPNHGSYGRNQFEYRIHLYSGLEAAGRRLLTAGDCAAAGVTVRCDLRTTNRLRYLLDHPAGLHLAATYFLIDEHALGCLLVLSGVAQSGIRLWLAQALAHNPATSRLWEHGLYAIPPGAAEPSTGTVGLQGICPEGDVWVTGVHLPDGTALMPSTWSVSEGGLDDSDRPDAREPADLQRQTLALAYDLDRDRGAPLVLHAHLVRGVSADAALSHFRSARERFMAALDERTREDERFWARAPQLTGDWPAHWRRGFTSDHETLRMTVRPPTGVFTQPWDGMQIQAPRSVLAETALDALALSWADLGLARDTLLACFAAAPRPNIPCMREDGSYNMVADDGAPCGTGPEWGFPLAVADTLYRRSAPDQGRAWLAALYPYAAAYLHWWLAHRTDADGWLVHACSWESGQDVSARFGEQRTGGSDVRHLRPVDLHASVAQGCRILAEWARYLTKPPAEPERWEAEGRRLTLRTQSMWRDGWYHDYDARAGRWSAVRDPMQLAPLACRTATPDAEASLRTAFDALPPHGGAWPPLVWPPVAHTVLEAASAVGLNERASELASEIVSRAWRRMDARALEPDGALPGITREFWPEGGTETSAGIEGYGWGALTVHFLLTYIAGFRAASPESLRLVPALPHALRIPGTAYTLGPLAWNEGVLSLTYSVPDTAPEAVDVELVIVGAADAALVARDGESGAELARGATDAQGAVRLAWRGAWLREVVIQSAGA